MKLNQNTSPVKVSGAVNAPSTFNIAASSQGFKILSSGLYNNKIRAIIRELSCNAYDAHVAAGKPHEPFDLHLPTAFEPFFSIKDTGTGLEYTEGACRPCKGTGKVLELVEEEAVRVQCPSCDGTGIYDAVRELYCTYFASDKSDSNLFVGALGLGSKSPLCYTEGFSITNTYNGMTRVYSCFINSDGMPAVVKQTEEETPDKVNGVEVSFPVKQSDVWEFRNQAEHALEFFNPPPNLNIEINIDKAEYSTRNKHWGFRTDEGKIRAIQGMVQYSIGDIDESRLTLDQERILKMPLDLFFPIGDLEVAASREALSNTEETVQNILKMLDRVSVGFVEDAKKKLAECRTPWEAKLMLFSLSNKPGIGQIIDRAYKEGEFDNLYTEFALDKGNPKTNMLDHIGVLIAEFSKSHSYNAECATKSIIAGKVEPDLTLKRERFDVAFRVDKGKEVFVINDVGFGMEKYIHHMLQKDSEFKYNVVYYINRFDRNVDIAHVIEHGAKIIEELGRPPVLLMSEVKAKYKTTLPKTTEEDTRVIRMMTRYYSHNYGTKGWLQLWEKTDLVTEADTLKYYVPVKNLEPQTGKFENASDFKDFVQAVKGYGNFDVKDTDPVYAVPFWYLNKLDDSWVNLVDHVMVKLPKIMTPAKELKLSLHLNEFNSTKDSLLKSIAEDKPLDPNSPLQKFCEHLAEARNYNLSQVGFLSIITEQARELGVYEFKHVLNFNDLWEEICEVYPILKLISCRGWRYQDDEKETVYHCIRLLDQERAQAEIDSTLAAIEAEPEIEEQQYAVN